MYNGLIIKIWSVGYRRGYFFFYFSLYIPTPVPSSSVMNRVLCSFDSYTLSDNLVTGYVLPLLSLMVYIILFPLLKSGSLDCFSSSFVTHLLHIYIGGAPLSGTYGNRPCLSLPFPCFRIQLNRPLFACCMSYVGALLGYWKDRRLLH